MKVFKFSVGPMGTNSYIVCDEISKDAFITDPGDEGEKLLNTIASKGLNIKYVILTHGHFDHIMALNDILNKTDAKLLVHKLDAPMLDDPALSLLSRFSSKILDFPKPDGLLEDGDALSLGSSTFHIIHTPGHTQGSICIKVGDDLISGDTLFRENIGRYDLPGGDFQTLMKSLKKIVSLEIKGKIYPGHGMSTTLDHELNYNTYLM